LTPAQREAAAAEKSADPALTVQTLVAGQAIAIAKSVHKT
jgi:hypothetical protein